MPLLPAPLRVRWNSSEFSRTRNSSASLEEALELRRAQLEVPAACASQKATHSLRNRELPQHLAGEKVAEHDAKRQGSTSNTPRSDSARAWAPHEYARLVGVGPVGSPPDKEDNSEPNNVETRITRSRADKPPKSSSQTSQIDTGVDKSSRGCGRASLLEAGKFRRPQVEVHAACACQGELDSSEVDCCRGRSHAAKITNACCCKPCFADT